MSVNRVTTTLPVIGQQQTSSPLVVVGPYIQSKIPRGFFLQGTVVPVSMGVNITGVNPVISHTNTNQICLSDRTDSSSIISHYATVQPTCSQIPIMQTPSDVCPLRIESVCGSYTDPDEDAPNENIENTDLGTRNDHSYFKIVTEEMKGCSLKQSEVTGDGDTVDSPSNTRPDLDAVLEELVLLSEAAASDTLLQDNPQNEALDSSGHQEYDDPNCDPPEVEASETNDSAPVDPMTDEPSACIDHSYQLGSKKRVVTVAKTPLPKASLKPAPQGMAEAATSKEHKVGEKHFLEVEIENEEMRGLTMREIRHRKFELRKAKARLKRSKGRFEQYQKKLRCLESLLFCEKTVERSGRKVIEISLSALAMDLYENVVSPSKEGSALESKTE